MRSTLRVRRRRPGPSRRSESMLIAGPPRTDRCESHRRRRAGSLPHARRVRKHSRSRRATPPPSSSPGPCRPLRRFRESPAPRRHLERRIVPSRPARRVGRSGPRFLVRHGFRSGRRVPTGRDRRESQPPPAVRLHRRVRHLRSAPLRPLPPSVRLLPQGLQGLRFRGRRQSLAARSCRPPPQHRRLQWRRPVPAIPPDRPHPLSPKLRSLLEVRPVPLRLPGRMGLPRQSGQAAPPVPRVRSALSLPSVPEDRDTCWPDRVSPAHG